MAARVAFTATILLAAVAGFAAADMNRAALMDLFQATGGAHWTQSTGWGSSAPYCTWFGVQCPLYTTTITHILLSNNSLSGTIPASVAMIKTLKSLDLSFNSIQGQLPDVFGQLEFLVSLNLNNNQITGTLPSNIANLTYNWPTLKEINLYNNQLTGTIPEDLFGPATLPHFYPPFNLQVLNLQYNQLSGPIPDRLIRAASMNTFMVGYNQLDAIPDTLTNFLSSVKYCSLGGNPFACPVPEAVSNNCQAYCS